MKWNKSTRWKEICIWLLRLEPARTRAWQGALYDSWFFTKRWLCWRWMVWRRITSELESAMARLGSPPPPTPSRSLHRHIVQNLFSWLDYLYIYLSFYITTGFLLVTANRFVVREHREHLQNKYLSWWQIWPESSKITSNCHIVDNLKVVWFKGVWTKRCPSARLSDCK